MSGLTQDTGKIRHRPYRKVWSWGMEDRRGKYAAGQKYGLRFVNAFTADRLKRH